MFTGAGGLALGADEVGFHHVAVVERDHDSCDTLRLNRDGRWPVVEADVRGIDYTAYGSTVDLIAGGVPCQPFSLGGKHKGHEDTRDMFPEFARAVAALQPQVFVVENVKGLLRRTFADYFEYVVLRLSHPLVTVRPGDTWREHRAELERVHTSGRKTGLDYNVVFQLLNAADYGVPQKRERVFIVGFRSDLGVEWSFPAPTHSREALLRDQLPGGTYWDRHKVPKRLRVYPSETFSLFDDGTLPWRTVRDAIVGLPKLKPGETSKADPDHFLNPGAKSYKGHTGSPLDEPAKTLKAGDHGVPGGENTLLLPDGTVRYFSVREAARIQTFPDGYRFSGSWTERMRQLGNAVPVGLAASVIRGVKSRLAS